MSATSTADESVLFSCPNPHVALVTINRPERRNAINGDVATAIERIVKHTEADPDIWTVILTGAGDKAFCAGGDLEEIAAGRSGSLATEDGGFGGFVQSPRNKPWIAAVNGAALAGGCELALACDMIVASDQATFGLPEAKRGLAAMAGGLIRLPRVIPRAIAFEMIATGRPITAEEAHRWGLVNRLTDAHNVVSSALELAVEISGNAPIAVRMSLQLARRAQDFDETTLFKMGNSLWHDLSKTEDFAEGPRAFVEKRSPNWTGR